MNKNFLPHKKGEFKSTNSKHLHSINFKYLGTILSVSYISTHLLLISTLYVCFDMIPTIKIMEVGHREIKNFPKIK